MYQSEDSCTESVVKTSDMSEVLESKKAQYVDFVKSDKSNGSDVSEVFALQRDLLETVRQNGDLRVEVERLRMDVERRDARIVELERQLAEALRANGRPCWTREERRPGSAVLRLLVNIRRALEDTK